ncbi:P-II family nitrogen regulator [Ferrimonas lipolytica]|uniref:P-II family nitrogen regulator n=1 Tax=Ferrimonas lipolytica TaxID=2724191 RepID=A0A6H1UBV5_9GAMM|nr:P-II family nitrogen regulator [Ferrimonas lipolytica]QIZ75853.1 P-II family nitrogen regulator [Ferrimonas lipolytica]
MRFKLIIAFVDEEKSQDLVHAARQVGATGVTLINHAQGEGLKPKKTFFGLTLESQRDVLLFVVEEHMAREVLENLAKVGEFDDSPGTGIALQIDVEDAVGVAHQIESISDRVEQQL